MSNIRSRQVMLLKIESTYGTDAVPVPATDAIRVENIVFAWSDVKGTQPVSAKPTFGAEPMIFGGALGTVTFDAYLKGSGAAVDVPPEIGPALRAAGLLETINATTSVRTAKRTSAVPI